jgi:hypothetical protein
VIGIGSMPHAKQESDGENSETGGHGNGAAALPGIA